MEINFLVEVHRRIIQVNPVRSDLFLSIHFFFHFCFVLLFFLVFLLGFIVLSLSISSFSTCIKLCKFCLRSLPNSE